MKYFIDFEATQFSQEIISIVCYREDGEMFYSLVVLTHTCPKSWEPVDLFLKNVIQSSVDKSMEYWLDVFKEYIQWEVWLFGHYHADRYVKPGVEMLYTSIVDLEEIWDYELKRKEE